MRQRFCKLVRCPRYRAEVERQGTVYRDVCMSAEEADMVGVWYDMVMTIDDRQCLRLRSQLRERKEVQGCRG